MRFWNLIGSTGVGAQLIVLEPYMLRDKPERFHSLRLHKRSENAWAIIEQPSGAIAMGEDDALLMRLTRQEAERLVEMMNHQLHLHLGSAHDPAANNLPV